MWVPAFRNLGQLIDGERAGAAVYLRDFGPGEIRLELFRHDQAGRIECVAVVGWYPDIPAARADAGEWMMPIRGVIPVG